MVKAGNLVVDESMSNNLTSTSGEVISASSSVLLNPLQQSFASTNQGAAAPTKKKRNLPGNPDPDSEVIALSPKSLLATNRFVCEICNKGFQRDQNLQLHKRGHNLPWKLKQRTSKDVGEVVMRKKVYVCPETTCVHHHPSRALGDLTGIKKHFSRKHGEKKWKCEKCSKRYAVQSDWKAHSKICGTREYKCDCGTLFSRRDSFITHRAFCDALAEESARAISNMGRNLQPQLHALTVKREEEGEDPAHVINSSSRVSAAAADQSVPPWLGVGADGSSPRYSINLSSSSPISLLDHNPNENPRSNAVVLLPPYQAHIANSPHMSATALLQKAAQMGVAMQITPPFQYQYHHAAAAPSHMSSSGSTTSFAASTADHGSGLGHLSARELSSFGNKAALLSSGFTENAVSAATNSTSTSAGVAPPNSLLHDMMMSSLSSSSSGFDEIIYMEHKIRRHPF